MIELLTTVAIIGVLAALIFPAVNGGIARAKYTKCISNLKQWGTAFSTFSADNDGRLPTSYEVANDGSTGWQEKIAPYLVDNAGIPNAQRFTMRSRFECPGNTKPGGIVYGANNYLRPTQYPTYYPRTMAALPDKRSDFVLLVENYTGEVWNMTPGVGTQASRVDYDRHKLGQNKTSNILFADFHVEGMTYQQTQDRAVVMIPPRQ